MDVYTFPPVKLVAFENTFSMPMGISVGISGSPKGSQAEPNRRMVTAVVPGIVDHGAGYIATLQEFLLEKLPLVEMNLLPMHWLGANRRREAFGSVPMEWTEGGQAMGWLNGNDELVWSEGGEVTATAGADAWPYLDCSGLTDGQIIAVGEVVTTGSSRALVTRPVTVSGTTARIYLSEALSSGSVTIGIKETLKLRIKSWPRSLQTLGNYNYEFNMVEVFDSDFSETLTVKNPW